MSKNNNDTVLSAAEESSYNLKMLSMEDSLVQNQQFATPSILYWPNHNMNHHLFSQTQTNKTSYDNFSSQLHRQRFQLPDYHSHNLSNIEKRRGLQEPATSVSAQDRTILDTSDLTTVTKAYPNRSLLVSNENENPARSKQSDVDSKKVEQSSRKLDSSFSSDFNVSKLQKRLEYSNLTNDDTIMSEPVTKIEKSKTRLYELSECIDEDEDNHASRLKNRADRLIEQSRLMMAQNDQIKLYELEQEEDDDDDVQCDKESEYIENININFVKIRNKQNEIIENVRMNSSKAYYLPQSSNFMVNKQFVQMKKTFNSINSDKKSPCVAWEISPKKRAYEQSDNFSKKPEYHPLSKRDKIQSTLQIGPRKLDVDFKENQKPALTEISTQTSFMVHTSNECMRSIRPGSILAQTHRLSDEIQKKKLKHMIAAQRHEKKTRQLEELMEEERIRAERVQRILLEMSNSSSTYSCMSSISQANLNSCHAIDDIQIVEFDSNKPPSHVQVIKENKLTRQPSKQTTELVENFDGTIMSLPRNEVIKVNQSMLSNKSSKETRMTLQEAFQKFRPRIAQRIERRQKQLEENCKLRREQAEFERRLNEKQLKIKEEEQTRKRQEMWRERYLAASKMKARGMTENEMRMLTRRNYERLPEVKQKVLRERLNHEKKLNQIRSKLYNNAIKRHVLMNGPNFGLRFNLLQ